MNQDKLGEWIQWIDFLLTLWLVIEKLEEYNDRPTTC
jgi:hypothetical protein